MSKEYFECLDKMRREQFIKDITVLLNIPDDIKLIEKDKSDLPMDKDIDLKKIQEQLSNKSFTKMCFSTNDKESIVFHRKDCEHEVIGHLNNLNNLLMEDVLFNRFIAKCVNNSKIEETTLIGMFAEFLTMMSDCESRKQDK